MDAQGDIYTSEDPDHIVEYAPGSQGNASTIRDISGSNTRLNLTYTHDFAVGPDGTIAALSQQTVNGCPGPFEIDVFAPGANGNVAPVRTIGGPNTGIFQGSLAIDAAGNIYLAIRTRKNVLVFDPSANGNASPTRTIAGGNTGLSLPVDIIVSPNARLAVLNGNNGLTWTVTEFPLTASGNATPGTNISGSGGADALAVDSAGYFYVAFGSGALDVSVNVYAPDASGVAAPVRSITLLGIPDTYDIAVH